VLAAGVALQCWDLEVHEQRGHTATPRGKHRVDHGKAHGHCVCNNRECENRPTVETWKMREETKKKKSIAGGHDE